LYHSAYKTTRYYRKNRDQRDRTDQRDGSPVPFSERPETEEKLTDIFG
jgi:hypothetical protein